MQIEQKIQEKLFAAFAPHRLTIRNDSHLHAHHVEAHGVPGTGDTHFTITIVSDKFAGRSSVECHRMVYDVLAEELAGPVHALALKIAVPDRTTDAS